ncbi:alternative ribosome rescue aminoacyl-tRNA hydrolase ArfB [Streptomyces sp. DSM 44915]|uniref:Alternative ribosome rescue aminoacyl-tRNA hydrolase ArfB n=1 Tax=Streptomyces chisholmiae TaxID=3075540 RepID=A0ABU2JSY1_9ACTN|nr:alternative ribosome rescue aminoacyl-tRNA hydrolase ArfB [Streptomyces sp. DSM 44915]MDT0268095.1 alternative ribosome rescue aminoacyl-tRNA hydrolase ArfB [Streptomyces sp. DSM 44915]
MARMSGSYRVRGAVSLPESELRWRFSRSSGPGGQHVNTSDTQAELRFDVAASTVLPEVWKERALARLAGRLTEGGELVVRASEHRSQLRNREAALRRLTELLTEATAPPPRARRAKKPPRSLVERRLREKRRRSELKKGRGGRAGWD